ncbi:MAG: hypothetical protein Q9187_009412 [Circinaria calcarea]
MGRFDYPSPYWDSVGDPALDLIDRMLTVDVDKRISIEDCLEHPWLTQKTINPGDSADSLAGAMDQLDFSKRKVQRERTMLCTINDIKISKVIDVEEGKVPIKVFEKNANGKRVHNNPVKNGAPGKSKGSTPKKEQSPAAQREPREFMEMGGKGDQPLFADDRGSRYEADEVPNQKPKGK